MKRIGYIACFIVVFIAGSYFPPWIAIDALSTQGAALFSSESGRAARAASLALEDRGGWLKPQNIGLLLLVLFAGLWLMKARRAKTACGLLEEKRAHAANHDRDRAVVSATADAPRELLKNPYGPEFNGLDFETRVQCAIEASLRASRVIGVIHLAVSRAGLHTAEGEPLPEASLEFVANVLRRRVRPSDCVRVYANGQIEIYISLLETRDHLRRIAARLAKAVRENESESQLALAYQPGCAIYPLDGYRSHELVEAAREDALSLRVEMAAIDGVVISHGPARLYPGTAGAI